MQTSMATTATKIIIIAVAANIFLNVVSAVDFVVFCWSVLPSDLGYAHFGVEFFATFFVNLMDVITFHKYA